MTRFRSPSDLPPGDRTRLGHLLLALADNKRLLGIRYSDWILGAPSVEAGIACSAMSQDEWGHGRIVYSMLKDFDHDPRQLEFLREADGYLNSEVVDSEAPTWPDLIALNLLWDTALSVQFDVLAEGSYEPLHHKSRKLLQEERYHFDHAVGWSERLMTGSGGEAALAGACGAIWNSCIRWFGESDDPLISPLADLGLVPRPRVTRARWLARVGPVAGLLGLAVESGEVESDEEGQWVGAPELHWEGWSASRRRRQDGGPDEDSLARVRGDRNRVLVADA
ncbi:MAG: phenylacetate-CoA oxygenase subunit PaaI [Gemmatimonadetes bacterium]|nr:phenylacetate-CoA oxygenase subunit PaaI [Gemmatimonadota bacterium]